MITGTASFKRPEESDFTNTGLGMFLPAQVPGVGVGVGVGAGGGHCACGNVVCASPLKHLEVHGAVMQISVDICGSA